MIIDLVKSHLSASAKRRIRSLVGLHPTSRLMKKMEASRGKLSSSGKTTCDEYAREVLGDKMHAPWLYVYTLVAGGFRSGWIPDSYYGSLVVPAVKGRYGDASGMRAFQALLFGDIFPDILYRINGRFFNTRMEVIPECAAHRQLFAESDTVVFKSDSSIQGKGVAVLRSSDTSTSGLARLGDGVFQRYIHQHRILERFHPGSVATLRLTTVVDASGDVSLRAAYLRFGSGNDSHVKSASHIRVPVDLTSGALATLAYTVDWEQVAGHPDSGRSFAGEAVPEFSTCVAKVTQLHKSVPFVQCVGWDATVSREGEAVLMEWNGVHNDIKFSEATQGPCFADLGWENLWRSRYMDG